MEICHVTLNLSGAQGTELEARIEQNNLNNINQLLNQSSMHNDRVENSQICRNIQKAITKKIQRNILELLNIPAKTEKSDGPDFQKYKTNSPIFLFNHGVQKNQENQRTHLKVLSLFQDGRHVKFPTLGKRIL